MSTLLSLSLFACLGAIVLLSVAFNIDDNNPKIYLKDKEGYFGYKILQYKSENEKWVLVSAPLSKNGTGKIFKCGPTDCDPLLLQASDSIKSIGMSLAVKSNTPAEFTACSPIMAHECDHNTYLNGICYKFNNQLQFVSNITPFFQECTKRKVDLVFMFDGSESLELSDYGKNKEFITSIMKTFSNTTIQFAALQFSTTFKVAFNFKNYQAGEAQQLLESEQHLRQLTNTYGAIQYILSNVFTEDAGAIEEAVKVLVIITDGSPTDNRKNVIEIMNEQLIIRYVIWVGNKKVPDEIQSLASKPESNHTFLIDNYSGLTGILDNLQQKIYNIEGTQNAHGRKFKSEMSQSGFSADYLENALVLGSVGLNNWKGSISKSLDSQNEEIGDPIMEVDSYMGYSVKVGKKNRNPVYFSGAPRFQHIGQVQVFYKTNENWTVKHRQNGTQIGSYFGGELCAMDIDSNEETDFLLVGAPLYHTYQREGMMFVYSLTAEVELREKINVSGSSQGRFASSIAVLQDLNGDGLKDVAVGAPLENNHKGAVYIYLGDWHRGIRPEFSQRITGQKVSTELRFFGLSIDGKMDQGNDGLVDIVVGAKGGVVVFRSRPVLSVSAQLLISPSEISTYTFHCPAENDNIFPVLTLTVCFNVTISNDIFEGFAWLGLNVAYQVYLDSGRQRSRAFLNDTSRKLRATHPLGLGLTCINITVYMPSCVKDTLSPMTIKLNYSQLESQTHNSSAILNIDSNTVALVEVPFKKNCKLNETCVSDLKLHFNCSSSTLLVVDQEYFNVTMSLFNSGDDSYNTSLSLHYPPGLSFSKMQVLKATRRTLINCSGLENMEDRTTCSVSLPVYPSQTTAIFQSLFRISNEYNWSDTMQMTIIAYSDNGNSSNTTVSRILPVQFAVDIAVKALDEDSITFVNFSLDERQPKMVNHIFEVKNLGSISLPVTITFTFPTELRPDFVMEDHYISFLQNSTQCGNITDIKLQDFTKNHSKKIECNIFHLNRHSSIQFILSVKVSFRNPEKFKKLFQKNSLEEIFSSRVQLSYDKQQFVQTLSNSGVQDDPMKFHKAEIFCRAELIILPDKFFIVGVGAGGGLFLLTVILTFMYWMGCFRRKRFSEEAAKLKDKDENVEETVEGEPEEKQDLGMDPSD